MLVIGYRPFMAKSTKSTPAEPDVPVEAVLSDVPFGDEVPVEPAEADAEVEALLADPVPSEFDAPVADEEPVEPVEPVEVDPQVVAVGDEGFLKLTRAAFDAEFARYRQMGLDERQREVELLRLELDEVRRSSADLVERMSQETVDVRQAGLEQVAELERRLGVANAVPGRAESLLLVSADDVALQDRPAVFRATAIELRELAAELVVRAEFLELEARYAERELGR